MVEDKLPMCSLKQRQFSRSEKVSRIVLGAARVFASCPTASINSVPSSRLDRSMPDHERADQSALTSINKVITTTVTRPLDDRTYCARSAFTHLRLFLFMASLLSQPMCSRMSSYWHFRRSRTIWPRFERGTFRPPQFGDVGDRR